MELIAALKKECGMSRKEAAAVVDLFFDKMSDALAKGDRKVSIFNFPQLYVTN
jgi:integration host factor subunit beta